MPDHDGIESALRALPEQLVFPPTPDIAGNVTIRLRARRQPPVLVAIASLVLISLVLLTPSVRAAIQSVFHAVGIEIQIAESPVRPPDLSMIDESLFGVPVSLEDAEAAFGRPLLFPTQVLPEEPVAIYLLQPSGSAGLTSVTFVYAATDGLPEIADSGIGAIFTQMVGSTGQPWLVKTILPNSISESVDIAAGSGWWIEDGRLGVVSADDSRASGHVLIWLSGDRGYRFESGLDREASIQVAESLKQP